MTHAFFHTNTNFFELAATSPAFDAPVAVASLNVTMNNTNDTNVLPCPHFEGVEKRIEIDFHAGGLQRGACPTLSFFQSAARFTPEINPKTSSEMSFSTETV